MIQPREPTGADHEPASAAAAVAAPAAEVGLDPTRLRTIGGLLGLTLAACALRAPFMNVPMINDEGGYAYVAHFWSQGLALYRDLPFDRPQGIFLIYRAILSGFGGDVVAIRSAGALCAAATVVAVFVLARAVISERAGWIAAALFALVSTSPSVEGFTSNAELFANLPLVVAAYCTWKQRWAAAGLLAGLACLIKPSGVAGLMLALGWAGIQRVPPRQLLICLAAFAIAPLGSLLHGAYVGFDAYFASLVADRLLAFSVVTSSAQTQWNRFADSTILTTAAWGTPAVLAALASACVPRKVTGFCMLWLVCALAGMALGGNWYVHYYMQLLPPLVLLAGGIRFGQGVRRGSFIALCALALGYFALHEGPLWALNGDEVSLAVYRRPGYIYSQQVADFVAAHTQPSDTIYVAFSEAQLYYLARRRAAVPEQLYWNQVEFNKRAFDAAMRAIDERRPAIIVWSQPPPHWISAAEFRDRLARGYAVAKVIGPIGIFQRRR